MSREADFMQKWQQRFVNERGGTDGKNFVSLVRASHDAHAGVHPNPVQQRYNDARTVRATLLGAAGYEVICQDMQPYQRPFSAPFVEAYTEFRIPNLPPPFAETVFEYHAALQKRSQQEPSQTPSSQATSFAFYEGAYAELFDEYKAARIAARDWGDKDKEYLERIMEPMRDFNIAMLEFFRDNVAICLSSLVVLGVGLCRAEQRVCSPEEHSKFFKENIDVVTTLASHTRSQLKQSARRPALPYDYGYNILQGDEDITRKNYLEAIRTEDGGWRARWTHPQVQKGNREHPGHCPGSDYNPIEQRTEDDRAGVEQYLEKYGLSGLIDHDGRVPSAPLVLSRLFPIAQRTVYLDSTWQKRVITV